MRKIKNEELGRLTAEEYQLAEKTPVVLVLDDVRSAMNVGSAFRTSDAFRIEKICLCGITATPPHREINKTALGAQEVVNWEKYDTIESCLEDLKKEGYQLVAVEQADDSTTLLDFEVTADEKYTFIFGNEVFGVSDKAIELANTVLEIPQYGTKHSLNISVSIGVIMWDYMAKAGKANALFN